jgi:antitoxin component HigA of HigAB toxin-antitoxin module
MRTTLTLDDDVAAAIERRRQKFHHSLKQEVNDLIRAGLTHVEQEQPEAPRFHIKPLPVGELLIPIDDVSAALDAAEGPWRG